jgi:hypothetical protein
MLATAGGGGGGGGGVWLGSSQKNFRTYQKKFPDIAHFFLNMTTFFRIYQKILPIYDILPIYIWAKNAILMTFFTQEKGTLLPEKGKLAKLGGAFIRPCITPLHS